MATSLGAFQQGTVLESILAAALTIRGAKVDLLLCDGFLPACQLTEFGNATPEELLSRPDTPRCKSCQTAGSHLYERLGIPLKWYSQFLTPDQIREISQLARTIPFEDIKTYTWEGIAVGEHALAGALRYFARGTLDGTPTEIAIVRRYLEASLRTAFTLQGAINQEKYEIACFHHGIYVPQGIIGEVCRKTQVRVITWNPAYRKHTFIFSHDDSYHHTMLSEPIEDWINLPWNDELEARTLEYLDSRRVGSGDWIWFHDTPREELDWIGEETGLDFSRPVISMLTNVFWDAQLHFETNAFGNMLEWIVYTMDYFIKRPDLQLAIRIHPAEVRGSIPSRQPLVDEINRLYPDLPDNIRIIPPESQVSTYALTDCSDAVLIFGTKTGIEVSSAGVRAIVAGEAWIRGKGFSYDAASPDEYTQILERLPLNERLSTEELAIARKYAFHFFFRRMIPLPFIKPIAKFKFAGAIPQLSDLGPGRYPGLDVICDGILHRQPFIYPAEREA
nr:capsule biosynthesis protein [Anaerolineae bacterium]